MRTFNARFHYAYVRLELKLPCMLSRWLIMQKVQYNTTLHAVLSCQHSSFIYFSLFFKNFISSFPHGTIRYRSLSIFRLG